MKYKAMTQFVQKLAFYWILSTVVFTKYNATYTIRLWQVSLVHVPDTYNNKLEVVYLTVE